MLSKGKILGILGAAAIGATIGFMLNPGDETTQTNWKPDNTQTEQEWNLKRQAVTPPAWNKKQ